MEKVERTNEEQKRYERAVALAQKNLSTKRFEHSVRVSEMALHIASHHHFDLNFADLEFAALMHDITKECDVEDQKKMLDTYGVDASLYPKAAYHGFTAAGYCKEIFDITNTSIINAIQHHVLGSPSLDLFGCVVYIADKIEVARSYPNVEHYREMVTNDFYKGVYLYLCEQKQYLNTKGVVLNPDTHAFAVSIETRLRCNENK